MNLRTIIDKCQYALNYAPETQDWEDNTIRVIGERYVAINSLRPWLFLIKRANLTIHVDIAGSSGVTCTGVLNAISVSFSGITFDDDDQLDGQTLVVEGREYTISYRSGTNGVILTEKIDAAFTGTEDWSIQYRAYPYPYDAAEILDITSRDDEQGRLIYLDWRTETSLLLTREETGDPACYIEDEHVATISPENIIELSSSGSTGDGDLIEDHVYQYCSTFEQRGIESAPGPISELEATDSGKILVDGLDDIFNGGNPPFKRYVYRRDKTVGGRWRRLTDANIVDDNVTDDGDPFYTNSGAGTINILDDTYLYEAGPRARFRTWNTTGTEKNLEIRYVSQPRKLYAYADTPVWPQQYHDLLVFAALRELCLAHGMPSASQMYAQREKEMLSQMEDRYLTRSDRQYIRRGFDRSLLRRERWGDPVKI